MRQVKPDRPEGAESVRPWSPDEIAELSSSAAAYAGTRLPPADDPSFDPRLERIRRHLEALVTDASTETSTISGACAVLLRVDALQRARVTARSRETVEYETIRSLCERLATLPADDLLDVGASEVCSAMGFSRALFSSVSPSMWVPRAVHLEPALDQDETEVRTFVTDAAWRLDWAPLESDVVRRRSATLVECAKESHRTFRPLMEVTRARSYVVAPVRAGRRVVGLLHGDRWTDGVDHDDLGRLEAYAQTFGAAIEHATMTRRVRLAAAHAAEVLAAAAADLAGVDGDATFLGSPGAGRRAAPGGPVGFAHDAAVAARLAELSPREFDVLAEMSQGLTNAEIAARLSVSEGTVKGHVKSLLRKLQVRSRAAATAMLAQHETGWSERVAR